MKLICKKCGTELSHEQYTSLHDMHVSRSYLISLADEDNLELYCQHCKGYMPFRLKEDA